MRILIVGAGAIGGYFGARLAAAGRDVTFLVREKRAKVLRERGLVVRSPLGGVTIEKPTLVEAGALKPDYDLAIVTCKAYDLPSVIADLKPGIGPRTAILPLLNGMAHLDALDKAFGAEHVLGGQCVIASTLAEDGAIVHLNESQSVTFGERDGAISPRVEAIKAEFADTKVPVTASQNILQAMWGKWVFLASLAASTCLMRAPTGAIVAAPGGADFLLAMAEECRAIAEGEGFGPGEEDIQRVRAMLTTPKSPLTASMLRDIVNGGKVEADHVIGDLIARGKARAPAVTRPNLAMAYMSLKAYEAAQAMKG